jgi:hypothetical protein
MLWKSLVQAVAGTMVLMGAAAGDQVCSDATQSFTYTVSVYSGGTPPMPDTVTRTESAKYCAGGECLALQNTFCHATGWTRQFDSKVNGTATTLATDTDPSTNTKTTTTAMAFSVRPTVSVHIWDGWLICAQTSSLFPPPATA